MIKAVIFDMDGTLVDSERVSQRAWRQAVRELDASVDLSFTRTFIGQNRQTVIAKIASNLGTEELAHRAIAMHDKYFAEFCKTDLFLKPGARESVEALKQAGCAVGLATSTQRERALERLERFGLRTLFDAITCGDEVEKSKPEPDIFLVAAQRLGADPEACAVAEDSLNGVRAGHAAGMHVFMVPDLVEPTPEVETMCDAVLPSLNELAGAVLDLR